MHRTLPAIVVSLCSCGIFGPDLEMTNRRLLNPIPAEYPGWYAEVEACLNEGGDFEAIIWYVADRIEKNGLTAPGIWQRPHTITIRANNILIIHTVKHEMVHHVRQVGDELHGTEAFDCAISLA